MPLQNAPVKRFRLRDGRIGTEAEALHENLEFWKVRKQLAEDRIEEIQRKLETAEGA